MTAHAPNWQYAAVLAIVACALAGVVLHFVPRANAWARRMASAPLTRPGMPAVAQRLGRRLAPRAAAACGGCKACGPAEAQAATVAMPVSRRRDTR